MCICIKKRVSVFIFMNCWIQMENISSKDKQMLPLFWLAGCLFRKREPGWPGKNFSKQSKRKTRSQCMVES